MENKIKENRDQKMFRLGMEQVKKHILDIIEQDKSDDVASLAFCLSKIIIYCKG